MSAPESLIDEDALTEAHAAVEDVLIEMRDASMFVVGPANGFVVNDYDGPNPIMRLGTRIGLRIAIEAYLRAAFPNTASRPPEEGSDE